MKIEVNVPDAEIMAMLKQIVPGPIVDPPQPPEPLTAIPLKRMFGVNAYPWDFTQDPKNVNITDRIFQPKFEVIKIFSAVRHYIDWHLMESTKGQFTFDPMHRGSWPGDLILAACKEEGIENLWCIKEPPHWLYEQWPDPHDANTIPATYGMKLEDPAAYKDFASIGWQVTARTGRNKDIDLSLVKVYTKPRWTADPVNKVKVGLDILKYIEADNERDRWWVPRGFSTAQQFAAQMSAFYDGHRGALGPGYGVKNADPSMAVVMGGLATPSVQYVRDMIDWCKVNRGGDLCWDVINYHQYSNDSEDPEQWGYATRGVAPELRSLDKYARDFAALGKELGQQVWVTETGYDVLRTPQYAPPIAGKSSELVQGDWIVRTALLYAAAGVSRVFFYQLFDDQSAGSGVQYSSSGLAKGTARRPAADYILQLSKLIGDYVYKETVSTEPRVDLYVNGAERAHVLWIADEKGRTGSYKLKAGTLYTLTPGASEAKAMVSNGTIAVSETPVVYVEG